MTEQDHDKDVIQDFLKKIGPEQKEILRKSLDELGAKLRERKYAG